MCLDSDLLIDGDELSVTLKATATLAASVGDFTLSVLACFLVGWYLGIGNFRFFGAV